MVSKEREELLRKADIAVKDLVPNGGLLNEEQQARFAEVFKEDPVIVKDPWIVKATLWVKRWFRRIVYVLSRR